MVEPFYFGPESQLLFGVYHIPTGEDTRRTGVVLCYPVGQEYIRAHRAFSHLARSLAACGFHVLRFDYYGSGDSMGTCEEGAPGRWIENISGAVEEIRKIGVETVALVGLRFGATMSLFCASSRPDIEAVVAWEPIVRGNDYVEELRLLHESWLSGSFAGSDILRGCQSMDEALGFPLTEAMRSEFDRYDLLSLRTKPARRVHIVHSGEGNKYRSLAAHLEEVGTCVSGESITSLPIWEKSTSPQDRGVVPIHVVEHITAWMSEVLR